MSTGFFNVPKPHNEPINSYAPNTPQREALKAKLAEMRSQIADVPMYIGSQEVRTNNKLPLTCPHDHQHILGYYHEGDATHVNQAIETALELLKTQEVKLLPQPSDPIRVLRPKK